MNKVWLYARYVPGTVPEAGSTAVNRTVFKNSLLRGWTTKTTGKEKRRGEMVKIKTNQFRNKSIKIIRDVGDLIIGITDFQINKEYSA